MEEDVMYKYKVTLTLTVTLVASDDEGAHDEAMYVLTDALDSLEPDSPMLTFVKGEKVKEG